jgi:hypothetical protein
MESPNEKSSLPIIPSLERAHADLDWLIGKVLAAFKSATSDAVDYVKVKNNDDESFYSHQVRYLAKAWLLADGIKAESEDGGEVDSGTPAKLRYTANTGIYIAHSHYLVRVLRDTNSGCLPRAGDSLRRARFFAQKPNNFISTI